MASVNTGNAVAIFIGERGLWVLGLCPPSSALLSP